MNIKKYSYLLVSLLLVNLSSTYVWASDSDSEDLSFSDTIRDLNSQIKAKRPIEFGRGSSSDTRIHAGFSFLNSVNAIHVNGKDRTRFEDGVGLSIGADLFDPHWMGEALLRNFGRSVSSDEEMSLREFDIRVNYLNKTNSAFGYRIINGLAARYVRWVDPANKININHATPHYILGFAFDIFATKNLSIGVEVDGRTALIGETIDRNAMDMSLKLDAYL